jgi:hypothetical protein
MLAIVCIMVGISFDPRVMFQAGGGLSLFMTVVLILKARGATTKPYKRTELWLLLPKEFRPPERYAQWLTATVLRDTYLTFAQYTAAISIGLWTLALVAWLAGIESQF